LQRGSTGCYDLVEEAFVACIKGYMPKPRRGHFAGIEHGGLFPSIPAQHYDGDSDRDDDNDDDPSYHLDEGKRVLANKYAQRSTAKGVDLNPSRYANAARMAGKTFPPRQMNGKASNTPSYSLVGSHEREKKEPANRFHPRPTVGAASQATSSSYGGGSDGMPAFHISDEQRLNELEKHYDDELDDLREIQALLATASNRNVRRIIDDERTLLSDWLEYVDEINDKNENMCKEEAS